MPLESITYGGSQSGFAVDAVGRAVVVGRCAVGVTDATCDGAAEVAADVVTEGTALGELAGDAMVSLVDAATLVGSGAVGARWVR